MTAAAFDGIGKIRLDKVPDPTVPRPTAAVVHPTVSAICGIDLLKLRGTIAGMKQGAILG